LFVIPWRTTIDTLVTYPTALPFIKNGVKYDTIEDEEIDFSDGKATVKYPIESIQAINWESTQLGNVSYTQGYKELTTSNLVFYGYGLAKISYTTKYLEYSFQGPVNKDRVLFIAETDEIS